MRRKMQVLVTENTHISGLHKGLCAVCEMHTLIPKSISPECAVDGTDGSAECTRQLEHVLWVLPETPW